MVVALAGAVVLGAGVYGTAFWLLHDAGPPPSAFEPAAAAVRAGYAPGDLIVLAPFYATRAREYLGDLHPVAVRDPLAEDLEVRRRVWLFALFGADRTLGPRFEAAGFVPTFARHDDGIAVLRYERPARATVEYDFVSALPGARIYHDRGDKQVACDKWVPQNQQGGLPGRWSCPTDPEWFYVGAEWHRMGEHLRRCLWAHPPSRGRLLIRFTDVPRRGVLVGRAGHTLYSARFARKPIHFDVEIDDLPLQRLTFALEDYFRPFRIRIPTVTTSTVVATATVTFAVSSPDAGANHFCFAADVRVPPDAERATAGDRQKERR